MFDYKIGVENCTLLKQILDIIKLDGATCRKNFQFLQNLDIIERAAKTGARDKRGSIFIAMTAKRAGILLPFETMQLHRTPSSLRCTLGDTGLTVPLAIWEMQEALRSLHEDGHASCSMLAAVLCSQLCAAFAVLLHSDDKCGSHSGTVSVVFQTEDNECIPVRVPPLFDRLHALVFALTRLYDPTSVWSVSRLLQHLHRLCAPVGVSPSGLAYASVSIFRRFVRAASHLLPSWPANNILLRCYMRPGLLTTPELTWHAVRQLLTHELPNLCELVSIAIAVHPPDYFSDPDPDSMPSDGDARDDVLRIVCAMSNQLLFASPRKVVSLDINVIRTWLRSHQMVAEAAALLEMDDEALLLWLLQTYPSDFATSPVPDPESLREYSPPISPIIERRSRPGVENLDAEHEGRDEILLRPTSLFGTACDSIRHPTRPATREDEWEQDVVVRQGGGLHSHDTEPRSKRLSMQDVLAIRSQKRRKMANGTAKPVEPTRSGVHWSTSPNVVLGE